jgi:hypothetical protein
LARERAAIAMFQEDDMQPKSIHDQSDHGAVPGFRVLDQDTATAVVRRHPPLPFASLAGEWDEVVRRADSTIDVDLYRRRIAARRRDARERAALTSACVGVLAMTAVYLTLFFVAAHMRASNDIHAQVPVFAIPDAPDLLF